MARLPDQRFAPDCTIRVDGRAVPARAGEPITAALLAAGRPLVARSHKFHRPRGPFCLAGSCHACLVRVDGLPNVRACQTPCRDGLEVTTQHALPTAAHDLLGVIDLATPGGLDHHHLGTSSLPLNRAVVAVSRRLAGLGRLPDAPRGSPETPVEEPWEALVIGAGPAGLAAAEALAAAGRRVLVADGEPRLGGRLRGQPGPAEEPWAGAPSSGGGWLERVAAAVARSGGELCTGTTVLGLWRDGGAVVALLHARAAPERLRLVRPARVILCSGGTAVPASLEDGDRPGILWGRGLAVALAEHGTVPGRRMVVLGGGAEAETLAGRFRQAGMEVSVLASAARALGRARVKALVAEDGTRHRCDTVAVVAPPAPATDLARHLGAPVRFDTALAAFALEVDANGWTGVPGLFAAGEVTGAMDARAAAEAGRRAGEAARG
jgi:sarcosine oxidase subunit alpha